MTGYRLTRSAEADLAEILNHIAAHSGVARALHVHVHFVQAFETLAANPGIGHRKPELTADPLRWWGVFRFLVVYDAGGKPIDVVRVLHGARDLAAALASDPNTAD